MAARPRGDTELGAPSPEPRAPGSSSHHPLPPGNPQGPRGHPAPPTRAVPPGLGRGVLAPQAGHAGAPRDERVPSARAAAPGVLRSLLPSLLPSAAPSQHPRSSPGRFGSRHRSVRGGGGPGSPARGRAGSALGSRSDRAMPKGPATFSLSSEGIWHAGNILGFPGHFPLPTLSKHIPWHEPDISFPSTNPRGSRGPSGRRGLFARFGIARGDKHV